MEKKEYNPEVEVFRAHHGDIAKTGQRQCEEHRWRKISDTEVACTLCPTVNIVINANEYVETN